MRSIGPMELLVILGIAVLLFGGKKIPEVAKGLGEGKASLTTKVMLDDEAKTVALDTYAATPAILQNVKR